MNSLQLDRDLLLKPLQSVTGIVERRQTLPILSNVLIEASTGTLSLTATDLEIQVTTKVTGIPHDASFSTTVSAKKILDILRALPEQSQVTLERKDSKLLVRAGRSRFNLQTLPANDFPRLPEGQAATAQIPIPQSALRKLLARTQYAMAQQDIRYYLNGMLFVVDGPLLTLVATDGHRLAMTNRPLSDSYAKNELIIPRKAVLELSRLLSESESSLLMTVTPNQVRFDLDGTSLITKVIDGKFPDYNRVVPTAYVKHFDTDRVGLLQALQRAAILSNEKFRGVRWIVTPSSLRVVCTNTEQEEAEEELEVSFNGDALDIGFNITYIQEGLNCIDSSEVRCSFGDANSSMLITLADHDDFKYVVMPMRI
ncbi:MAG: DNA polymerase III subunit beta [Betaproteobacteria bacterium]|nr:DNA polymerase III subunit beta [Betaproteobacteria bacterium]